MKFRTLSVYSLGSWHLVRLRSSTNVTYTVEVTQHVNGTLQAGSVLLHRKPRALGRSDHDLCKVRPGPARRAAVKHALSAPALLRALQQETDDEVV